ncbi:sigma-70 family RNA polymerase sigma factor [Idiomarina sp. M1R2S28]|uniref:Sigma-70 family RNA polymerase sigma factor n=1 Tax=Idiomarina rhizosphaerae TaxID=2961572 RepID=A0A9X2FTQ0_9GAMM|nr:sigma-70 family RNA polymerase sigma factor [Idiomarina rhizosphaerae]MCP1339112.1 sigma-70 family RNA polymerase sigma factor [Idiomarina rhizosphaerae]
MQSETACEDVRLAAQGDVEAFQRLYHLYIRQVYGLVLRLCADRTLADDVVQEVFVQLWQKLSSFRGEAKFSSWLYRVATNICLTEMRKRSRWFSRFLSQEHKTYEEFDEGEMDIHQLDRLIFKLPEQTRQVFVLHALQGESHQQIANWLGIAVGTSKAQFHRARKKLEESLQDGE